MTEPLYTYEYETAGGYKGLLTAYGNDDALWMVNQTNTIAHQTSIEDVYEIIKLTNTHTKEVIYEVEK